MPQRKSTLWTAEKVDCLKKLWVRDDVSRSDMVHTLNFVWEKIEKKAAELNLGPPPEKRDGRAARGRAVGELRHRASLGFRDPIELRSGTGLFGAPIRAIDADTRALIDAALAKRASA